MLPVRTIRFLDGAGRSSATQRYIGTTEEKQWETACDRSERVDYHLYESYLGFSRHLHPQLNCSPWTDIKLHRFDPKSLRLRGLAGTDSELTKEGHWSEYGMPEYQTVLSATCSPSLLADAACYEVLHPTKYFKTGGKRPTELHVVLRCESSRQVTRLVGPS